MTAGLTVEERFGSVEAPLSALDHLPAQVNRLKSRIREMREELLRRIDDARREARVLHENAIGRIAMIGEGLDALSQKVDRLDTTLSQRIDGADAKLDLILARLDSPRKKKSR